MHRTPDQDDDHLLTAIAGEFDLGRVIGATPLAGGGAEVLRLSTDRGEYVIKRPWDPLDVELASAVEARLNQQGIRQARQHRTRGGGLIGSTGHAVQELLPGAIVDRPTTAQTTNLIIHLAAYDRALSVIEPPPALAARDTIWSRVVRTDYLLEHLPSLITRYAPDWLDPASIGPLLAALEAGADALAAEPIQLVHGDLGPDNVLYEGDEVVALIDFTPFHETVLLGLASAIYFFQLHGASPTATQLSNSIDLYGSASGDLDTGVAWTALVRESLRRLATTLAVAEERGTPPADRMARRRYEAAVRLAATLP